MKKNHCWLIAFLVLFLVVIAACSPTKTVVEPTPTSLPTSTPVVPTPTSLPTSIPGFTKITGTGVEIWFPESWQGGDLANDLDIVVEQLKTLGPEFDPVAQMIEANPSAFALWVFDSNTGDAGFLTNANLVKEKVVSAVTLDLYIDAVSKQLPSSFVITDQKKVQLNQYDSARLEIEMNISGTTARELMFIIKEKNTMWSLTFATSEDEFAERVPVFEQIASTISISP